MVEPAIATGIAEQYAGGFRRHLRPRLAGAAPAL